MTEKPSAHERLLWIVVACLAWKYATVFEAAGVSRDNLFVVTLWVAMWGFGLAALVLGLSDRVNHWLRGWPIFGFFTSTFVAYGIINVVVRSRDPYTFTTDAHTFMDYAARLLLDGKNPYQWSLAGAFVTHQMPSDLQTPLENAGLSDRLAYPSLSFLYLVPFVKLGITTNLAYAVALYGCLAVIFWAAPRALRPLVLLPFFVDPSYLAYAFGGLTDTVWAFCLCAAVVFWKKRPALAALFVGLASSYKQHACLLVPFLLVRLWVETPKDERRRVIGRFVGIVGGVFAAINVPFLLWAPKDFMLGMVEPLVAEMVPLGEGPTAFVVLGAAVVPKPVFSLFFWGSFFALLYVCAKWSRGRQLVWIAPSLAFFLNYRSLSSYWYFNLLPFVLDVAITPAPETSEPLSPRAKKVLVAYAATLALVAAIFAFYSVRRHHDLEVTIREPMRTWMANTHRLDLHLKNVGTKPIHMRYWMQGNNFQPLPWKIDEGPHSLNPGEEGDVSISAVMRSSAFEMMKGGTLTIDDPNGAFRKQIQIPPDPAWGSARAIPNAHFRFWDVRMGTPAYWGLSQHGTPGAYALPLAQQKGEGGRAGVVLGVDTDPRGAHSDHVQFCLGIPNCWASPASALLYSSWDMEAKEHTVALAADLWSRTGKVAVWGKTPANANRPPFGERYGVRVAIDETEVLLLLGGEAATGRLEDATPYEVVTGPRDTWTRYEIDFDALQAKYAPNAYPKLGTTWRYPLLDNPLLPMRFGLEYTTQASTPATAVFGEIEDPIQGREDPAELYREIMKHPAQIDLARAQYELQYGNPTRGSRYLARGRARESALELDLFAANLASYQLELDEAKALYERIEPTRPADANLGIGWILMRQRNPKDAVERFERAKAAFDRMKAEKKGKASGGEELGHDSAIVGIVVGRAQMSDCESMRRAMADLPARDREGKLLEDPSIKLCMEKLERK